MFCVCLHIEGDSEVMQARSTSEYKKKEQTKGNIWIIYSAMQCNAVQYSTVAITATAAATVKVTVAGTVTVTVAD
jgi:hypothetical protein